MTTFQHKSLPITISYSEWSKLSGSEQNNFAICNSTQQVTNNTSITNTTTNSETSDLLGLGKVAETAATVAILPIAIVGGLLGFFD